MGLSQAPTRDPGHDLCTYMQDASKPDLLSRRALRLTGLTCGERETNMAQELALVSPTGLEFSTTKRSKNQAPPKAIVVAGHSPGQTYSVDVGRIEDMHSHYGQCDLTLSILLTCRQIYMEASGVLYGQSMTFKDNLALNRFLSAIGANRRALLKNVTLFTTPGKTWPKTLIKPTFAMLVEAVNLRQLVDFNELQIPKNARLEARHFFRALDPYFRPFGLAKESVDSAEAARFVRLILPLDFPWDIGATKNEWKNFNGDLYKASFDKEMQRLLSAPRRLSRNVRSITPLGHSLIAELSLEHITAENVAAMLKTRHGIRKG